MLYGRGIFKSMQMEAALSAKRGILRECVGDEQVGVDRKEGEVRHSERHCAMAGGLFLVCWWSLRCEMEAGKTMRQENEKVNTLRFRPHLAHGP